jgi:hypothetical protein
MDQTIFKCCIVETRIIENIEYIIKNNHLDYLPDKYILHIFCSKQNHHLFDGVDFGRKTIITILENEINNAFDYSELLTNINFWKNLNCDKVLIFQSDSGLLSSGIERFEVYDWVGAPWKESGLKNHINEISLAYSDREYMNFDEPWFSGSNGGLSIRSVGKMIECIEKYPWIGYNEDIYFCTCLLKLGANMSREINYKFSVETEYRLGSIGYHAIDKWLSESEVYKIKNQYKNMNRVEILNKLVEKYNLSKYLEIGVRDPNECFNSINCQIKMSVDPGHEYENKNIDFNMTSDEFFNKLNSGDLSISSHFKWDLIFIDGLHISQQVKRDVLNSLEHISENGYIVLHDCNPPDIFHAREDYYIDGKPQPWNGTVWKVIYWLRTHRSDLKVCVVDTDYGVGIIKRGFSDLIDFDNEFFEYNEFAKSKQKNLNLIRADFIDNWLDD